MEARECVRTLLNHSSETEMDQYWQEMLSWGARHLKVTLVCYLLYSPVVLLILSSCSGFHSS